MSAMMSSILAAGSGASREGRLCIPFVIRSRPRARAFTTPRTRLRCQAQAASPPEGTAIDAAGLSVSLGQGQRRRQVLKGIDFRADWGSFHMLLGPNGCGKSTLLRTLGGLIKPDGGNIRVAQPTSFVFQNPDHQVIMPTVRADVAFGLGRYARRPRRQPTVWWSTSMVAPCC